MSDNIGLNIGHALGDKTVEMVGKIIMEILGSSRPDHVCIAALDAMKEMLSMHGNINNATVRDNHFTAGPGTPLTA